MPSGQHGARITRREAEQVLSAAAETQTAADDDLTMDELSQIAAEAEIDPGQLQAALHRVRGRRRLGLVVAAAGVAGITAALLLVPLARRAPRAGRQLVRIHNEHPRRGFGVELFVPRPGARDEQRCAHSPTSRVAAGDYCQLARTFLAPGARYSVKTPAAPRGCSQVWVRVFEGHGTSTSALFTLPASVEIERSGRLDRKGLGHPGMYGTPELPFDHRFKPCPSFGAAR